MNIKTLKFWVLSVLLTLCCATAFSVCSDSNDTTNGKVTEIVERGTLIVGTTGDYRPLTFRESDGTYWGFGIELAQEIASELGVKTAFVQTSWPTLTADVLAEPQIFDLAIGGITITDARCAVMLMSEGYLANGKTILCRASDTNRFRSLADIDKPEVRVMVNPGGLNEQFANENLTHATIIVHQNNEEIPALIAEGEADVMITEITEAPYYVQTDTRLAAPLLNEPFTHGEIGVLMQKGQEDLLQIVNNKIEKMKADGALRRLHEKYGVVLLIKGIIFFLFLPAKKIVVRKDFLSSPFYRCSRWRAVKEQGVNPFYESIEKRHACCEVRKLEPLRRAFKTLDAWICGLRKEQSVTRKEMKKIEWDEHHQLLKINPLIDWPEAQVWEYIKSNHVPYNKLHDNGYPSIGCEPCTRAVKPGEDIRAGRWWWESPEHRECGLHAR